ncbi:diguanylate cyclase [Alkaliphilus metalliredigens QYMF]|uniref:Diguanylate cyclase n=1 Tax=Alkaliphilus metalliredigens (strain QYMF) TaxID=293826 RepID=A6TSY5_ALKMQ|nr:GGDEF domain-containing protein [Alkaliphilus metalliredigens]ABR49303.1 diguanylate cyclase [Alkaliphilus metalliredigens QYMF]
MIHKIEGIMTYDEFVKYVGDKLEGSTERFVVARIDIDNFDAVNRYYGEMIGDEVIEKMAYVLKQNLKATDMLCWVQKDDFNILLDHIDIRTAAVIVEEIREHIERKPFQLKDGKREIRLKMSAGIAAFPKHGQNKEVLIERAFSALKQAKQEGKNRVVIAESEEMEQRAVYYMKSQLKSLNKLSQRTEKTEALLLREALDNLITKYQGNKS